MSWCGCVCDTVEDAAEWVEDQVEDATDGVVDAVEDGLQVVGDFFEDVGEWVEETIDDVGEFISDVAAAVWDWITEAANSVWDWIKKVAGDVWEWTTGALEDAWDWAREAASDAWDWINDVANTVWDALCTAWDAIVDFVEERVIPFLEDVFWVLTHLDDLIIAGVLGLACLLTEQDEKEYDLIEGLYLLDETALATRKVTLLSDQQKYVVFSDHHLFVAGDPLDRFRQIGNHELYQAVLAFYYVAGYTLVENGDVEDLWMREATVGEALLDEATDVLGWPYGDAIEQEHENYRIRSQAVKIFVNNQDVYQTIRNLYHDRGRFVRLLGNHDDAWRDSDYVSGLQLVYPGIEVFDYALIGNYSTQTPTYGNSPKVIIAHGHQLDAWNNSICRAAGAAITEAVSGIPSLAASVKERSEWEAELKGLGFPNELSESIASIDELEFYETIEDDFSNYAHVPQFILGHTHSPLEDPQIPDWMYRNEWNFTEYTNDGTAGRWEQFIWCATVENGSVGLHGWTWGSDGKPVHWQFRGGYADFLQPV
jgi:hypothetical protein